MKGEAWARDRFPECYAPLLKENRDAVRVYLLCQGQMIRAGMEGVAVAIDHMPVWEAIDRYQAKDPVDCFEKVLMLAGHFIEAAQDNGQTVEDPMDLLKVHGEME